MSENGEEVKIDVAQEKPQSVESNVPSSGIDQSSGMGFRDVGARPPGREFAPGEEERLRKLAEHEQTLRESIRSKLRNSHDEPLTDEEQALMDEDKKFASDKTPYAGEQRHSSGHGSFLSSEIKYKGTNK